MGFVEETGSPGLAAAATGIATQLRVSREIQESQDNRVLALKELQLRNDQHDLALDAFAYQQERDLRRQDQMRQQLGLQERKVSLEEQTFDYMKAEQRAEREREQMRSEALVQVQRVFDDDYVSDEEFESIFKAAQHLDPRTLNSLFAEARNVRRRQIAAEQEQRQQYVGAATKFVLESGAATEEELLMYRNHAMKAGNMELYNQAVFDLQEKAIARAEVGRQVGEYIAETRSNLSQATAMSNMSIGDRQQAHLLLERAENLAKVDPNDPRIADVKDQVRVLMMDPESRKEREHLQKQLELQKSMVDTYMQQLSGPQAEAFQRFSEQHFQVMKDRIGPAVANHDARLGHTYQSKMAAVGAQAPPKPVPVDAALPQMLEYAFQGVLAAKPFLEDLEQEAAEAHLKGLFERAGIKYDTAEAKEQAQAAFAHWFNGDQTATKRVPSGVEVAKFNLQHGKGSDEDEFQMELASAVQEESELEELNKELRKRNLPEVPLSLKAQDTIERETTRQWIEKQESQKRWKEYLDRSSEVPFHPASGVF